jgi:hypothetical protein
MARIHRAGPVAVFALDEVCRFEFGIPSRIFGGKDWTVRSGWHRRVEEPRAIQVLG